MARRPIRKLALLVGLGAVAALAASVAGCADRQNPPADDLGVSDQEQPPVDHGGGLPVDGDVIIDLGALPDSSFPPGQDTDGDGLCDAREVMRNTNLAEPDTDGDELSDYFEILLGTNALDPNSPDPSRLVFLSESPSGAGNATVRRRFTGSGEDFTGAFVGTPFPDPDGLSSFDFFSGARATYAAPMSNVAAIDGERFIGVIGTTELGWEIEFAIPVGFLPRGCVRAYPFRYDVKRSDGRYVAFEYGYLVMIPAGGTFAESPSCVPTRCI